MKKVLVIGGPGNISASTLDNLVEKGYKVGLFSNKDSHFEEVDPSVTIFPGDREDVSLLERDFKSFTPDYVLDMACFLPEHAEQISRIASGHVEQFIFVSTVDVYGFPLTCLPMSETEPWQKKANSDYAENKRRCEIVLKAKAENSNFPLTIVRPSYSFSERFIISALSRSAAGTLLYRLKNKLPIFVPGDGRTLIHVSSGYNTGRMISEMTGCEKAIGKEYNLANPTPMEYVEYIQLFANAIGTEPMMVFIPSNLVLSIKDASLENNLLEELAQYNLYFSIDSFLSDFPDFIFEPLEIAAQRVVSWQFHHNMIKYSPCIDDRIITEYQRCIKDFSLQ